MSLKKVLETGGLLQKEPTKVILFKKSAQKSEFTLKIYQKRTKNIRDFFYKIKYVEYFFENLYEIFFSMMSI